MAHHPITLYDTRSAASAGYRDLAAELIRGKKTS
jgi:hypothetical protein